MYRPITRPRITAVVPSCMVELVAVVSVSSVSPVGISMIRKARKSGIRPVRISNTLNAIEVTSSSPSVGRPRWAAISAPPRAPSANTAEAIPNAPAPVWNTPRDISALVTWKFIPKVETKKIRISVIHSVGRART